MYLMETEQKCAENSYQYPILGSWSWLLPDSTEETDGIEAGTFSEIILQTLKLGEQILKMNYLGSWSCLPDSTEATEEIEEGTFSDMKLQTNKS